MAGRAEVTLQNNAKRPQWSAMGPPGTFCFVWLSLHQHHTYIIYIGAGGAGDQQPAHCLQGVVGVSYLPARVGHGQAVGGQRGQPCRRPRSRPPHRWGRRCRRCPPRTPPACRPCQRRGRRQRQAPGCARPGRGPIRWTTVSPPARKASRRPCPAWLRAMLHRGKLPCLPRLAVQSRSVSSTGVVPQRRGRHPPRRRTAPARCR